MPRLSIKSVKSPVAHRQVRRHIKKVMVFRACGRFALCIINRVVFCLCTQSLCVCSVMWVYHCVSDLCACLMQTCTVNTAKEQPSMTLCQNDGWSSAAHVDSPAPDGASLVLTNDFVRRIMDTCQKDHVLQGWECQQKQPLPTCP